MQSIKQLYQRSLKFNHEAIIRDSVVQTKENIVSLNKDQLYRGINSKDEIIGEVNLGLYGYKTFEYANEKYRMNPLPGLGNPDLFLNGDFYNGIMITISGKRMSILSTDSKNEKLFQKYPHIFGLGPVRQRIYIKDSLQIAVNRNRINQLGL